jgi:V/A-type H+/Na+-transporting ATPase subunit I
MIVSMSRVAVLGPRRLQGAVVKEVQDLGALHVDHVRPAEKGFEPRALPGEEQTARDAIDGVRTRAEAILALLPVVETPPGPTGAYAEQTPEALRSRLDALEVEVKDLTRRLLEAEEEQEILRAYGRAIEVLSPLLMLLETSQSLEAVGFVLEAKPGALEAVRAELDKATQGRVELVGRPVDDHRLGAVAAFGRQDAEAVRAVLARSGASELRLPASVRGQPLGQAVPYLEARARDLPRLIEDLRRQLMEMSRRHRAEVAAIATVARDAVHRFEIMNQIPQSRYAFVLYGWVPTKLIPTVREGLRKRFGREVVIYDEPAPVHHADHVPVLLENPAWLRPFELFLAIFNPPKYGTFDVTLLFAIGLPLWVGLIIGDVGYGLPLLALTLWLRGKALAGRPWRARVGGLDFGFTLPPAVLRSVATVLGWMTAWTFLFGIVFGEFFGDLPARFIHPFNPAWHPLYDRLENSQTYLYLSIGFGLAQVYLGLILQMVKSVRHGERRELLEALALAGGGATIFLWIAIQAGVLPRWLFSPVMLGAAALFLLALLLSFTLSSLMWVMESVSTFGAFVSYARIAAVGTASLGLAIVANTLGGGLPVLVLGIFVGAVAHVMFFGLTVIGHVLQPARLYWVEFFSRFKYYQDTGPRYRPFQHSGGGQT